jgi:hypothetical protein
MRRTWSTAVEVTPESIAEAASKPAEAAKDGQSAKAVPIPDQIEAAKFNAAATTTAGTNSRGGRKSAWRGTIARGIPPGAV